MRLQSAIFYLEDTLLLDEEAANSAEKVLSILKMESVWLAAVTKLSRAEAESALKERKLLEQFRLLLPEKEAFVPFESEEILLKAMRRLLSQKRDTVVFCGRKQQIETAQRAGFRAAAIKSAANADEWTELAALADEAVEGFDEFLK